MPRHYTDVEKRLVLDRLIANHGDVARTAAETGVSDRAIYTWRTEPKFADLISPLLPHLPHISHDDTLNSPPSLAGEGPGVGVLSEEITERLTTLREEMLDAADTLSRSIISAIEEAPLNQRVTALSQLIDRIIKLATQLPNEEIEYVYEYEVEHHVEKKKDFETEAEDSTA
jgi:hypothetical protein